MKQETTSLEDSFWLRIMLFGLVFNLLVVFGFHCVLMRYLTSNCGLSALYLNIDAHIVPGVLLTVLDMIYSPKDVPIKDYYLGSTVSCLQLIGFVFITRATAIGPSGPIQALTNIQSLVQTVLSVILLNQAVNGWHVAALLATLIGGCCLSIK